MASDVMAVRLHLRQIRVLEVLEDAPDVLRVSVESTFRRLRCAQCGFKCHRVHDRRDKKIRDLGVSGRPTTLVWSRRRMACDNCGSRFLEDHPAFGARSQRVWRGGWSRTSNGSATSMRPESCPSTTTLILGVLCRWGWV